MRRTPRKIIADLLYGLLGVLVFLFFTFPVYWMVNTSLLPSNLIRGPVPHLWPDQITLQNYTQVLNSTRSPILPALTNTLLTTLSTVVVCLVLAFLAAIALTRFQFRGRRSFILSILIIQMLPGEAMIVSMYRVLDGWELLNTIAGLTLVYVSAVLPFTIWTLRGFVNGVPIELEEAAMIDGCSRFGAFRRITLPLLAPGLVATGIFGFIMAWNEFIVALVVMSRPESMTLTVWLSSFVQKTENTNWAAIMAGSTLMAIPVVIFFLLVQRRITAGLVSGAVKG